MFLHKANKFSSFFPLPISQSCRNGVSSACKTAQRSSVTKPDLGINEHALNVILSIQVRRPKLETIRKTKPKIRKCKFTAPQWWGLAELNQNQSFPTNSGHRNSSQPRNLEALPTTQADLPGSAQDMAIPQEPPTRSRAGEPPAHSPKYTSPLNCRGSSFQLQCCCFCRTEVAGKQDCAQTSSSK